MAIKNNLFPDIQFEEINDSPRPAQLGSVNRIGVVGVFRKGPKGVFRLRGSFDEFSKMFGATLHTGSVGVQAALDQGADDLGIIRVMGDARRAKNTLTFGVSGSAGAGHIDILIEQFDDDNTTLLSSGTASVAVTAGMAVSAIANEAANQLNITTATSALITAVYETGGVVTIQAENAGSMGNYIKFTATPRTGSIPANVAVTPDVATNLLGGADGPTRSKLDITDRDASPAPYMTIYSAFEGLWGDEVQITISNGTLAGRFNLVALDTANGHKESYFDVLVDSTTIDPNTNQLLATANSNLIRVQITATNFTKLPAITTDVPLNGGSDGPPIIMDDYVSALKTMEISNVNILMAPGITDNNIRSLLISQAEASGPLNGYRIAVINGEKNMPVEALDSYSQNFQTGSGSAVMVAGWASYAGQTRLARFGASPDGFYAGHLAVTAVQVSPAARSSSPFFQSITEVDTIVSDQAFNSYTKARMEAIIRDPVTGGFHCLNGRTLSSDGAWYWISVRRVYNQIKQDLFRMVQWVKSSPNTSALRAQLAQQLDTYMQLLLSRGIIANTKASQVDSVNNPPAFVASGYLRAEVFFTPVFPADHTVIGVHRYLSADVLVGAA